MTTDQQIAELATRAAEHENRIGLVETMQTGFGQNLSSFQSQLSSLDKDIKHVKEMGEGLASIKASLDGLRHDVSDIGKVLAGTVDGREGIAAKVMRLDDMVKEHARGIQSLNDAKNKLFAVWTAIVLVLSPLIHFALKKFFP